MELNAPFSEANGRHDDTIEQREYRTDIIRSGYEASSKMINYLISLSTGGGKTSIIAAILYEFLFKENDNLGNTSYHHLPTTQTSEKWYVRDLEECEGDTATILNQLDHSGRSVLAKAIDNYVSESVRYSIRQSGGIEIRSTRRDVLIFGHTHVIKTQNRDTIQQYFDKSCRDEVEFCCDVKKYAEYRAKTDERNAKPCIVFAMNTVGAEICEASLLELDPTRFRAIVVDEAHHCPADMYLKIFAHFGIGSMVDSVWENNRDSPIWVLGATATKQRADNKRYYGSDEYLFPQVSPPQYTFDYLLENKYLAPVRSVSFGDDDVALESAVINSVNHVIKCFMTKSSEYSHVLTFALYIEDARAIKERFDMVAKHMGCKFVTKILVGDNTASTSIICDEFKRGVIQNIVSVGMLLEGFNVPIADTIVLLRKSSSERVILQSIGRGTRLYPGKECVQVIDPYSNVSKLNLDNVESTVIRTYAPTDSGIDSSDCEGMGDYLTTPGDTVLHDAGEDFQSCVEEATSLPCEERAVTCVAGAVANHPLSHTLDPTTETWTGIKRICDSTDDRDVKRVCENSTYTINDSGKLEFDDVCTALGKLYLEKSMVRDITNIRNCAALTELCLSGTKVDNINPLANLKALTVLNLFRTKVKDIAALGSCTALTKLNLGKTKVKEINALGNCTALIKLSLDYTLVQDITALGSCTALTKLNLGKTKVKEINALGNCTELTKLSLDYTWVQDITALGSCTALIKLSLDYTSVQDITALGSCTALTSLDLEASNVEEITALGNCTALTYLSLCIVDDLSPLSSLAALTQLSIYQLPEARLHEVHAYSRNSTRSTPRRRTMLTDITALGNCTALVNLKLKCSVTDISALGKCTELTVLDMRLLGVRIGIEELLKCTKLVKLNGCKVRNLQNEVRNMVRNYCYVDSTTLSATG